MDFEPLNLQKESERIGQKVDALNVAQVAAVCGGNDLPLALAMAGCGNTEIMSESEREAREERLAQVRQRSIESGRFQR